VCATESKEGLSAENRNQNRKSIVSEPTRLQKPASPAQCPLPNYPVHLISFTFSSILSAMWPATRPHTQYQMQTQTTQPLPRYSQYTVRLMAPRIWRTLASAAQALWPTFDNHQIYQLQPVETKSAPNVIRLLLAETECPPKVPICPHLAPKPKLKLKFGRSLVYFDTCCQLSVGMVVFIFIVYTLLSRVHYCQTMSLPCNSLF